MQSVFVSSKLQTASKKSLLGREAESAAAKAPSELAGGQVPKETKCRRRRSSKRDGLLFFLLHFLSLSVEI
jgi:hypothetical protein